MSLERNFWCELGSILTMYLLQSPKIYMNVTTYTYLKIAAAKALSKVPRNLWKNTVQIQHQNSLYGHCSVFIVEFEQVFSTRERSSWKQKKKNFSDYFRGYKKEYWPTKLFSHSVAFIVNFNQTSSNVLKCTLFT